MDSWSFSSVGKDFTSDESFSTSDAFGKHQIESMGWEVKPPFIFGNNNMGLFPNEINIQNQVFEDMGFPPLMINSLFNPVMAAFSEENDSSSKLESNSRESELFDLNLGRFIDPKEVQNFNSTSKIAHNNLSSSEVSMPSKRPREGGFGGSSIPICKVYGCNKNLSNCKDYHRRHKVCEAHSKTSKVIVNGIEQRFCQQCSRFHLLREFDDGKRSCRKRLAGHNERRRKPHAGALSDRYGRLLPSYNIGVKGNEYKGPTRVISSFHIPDHLRNPYQPKHEINGRWETNLEEKMAHDLQSISCITDEIQLHSKSFPHNYNFETNPRLFDGIIVNAPIGLSGMASSSECALSLLSSDHHHSRSSCNSSRNMFPCSHDYQDSSGPLDDDQDLNRMVGFEGGDLLKFGSKEMNSDEGCTIDLLQLSSQLQRVDDHQKKRSQMKLANGVSVGLRIT